MTPELKPKTPELKPKTPELKPKTLDLKLPKLKTKRRLRFWLRWRQTQEEKGFPERKRLENEVPGLQKAPRERQETARSAPGAPSVPPGASKSRQERPGSPSGGTRSAPKGPRGVQRRHPLGRPGGRPGPPGGFKNTKIE